MIKMMLMKMTMIITIMMMMMMMLTRTMSRTELPVRTQDALKSKHCLLPNQNTYWFEVKREYQTFLISVASCYRH